MKRWLARVQQLTPLRYRPITAWPATAHYIGIVGIALVVCLASGLYCLLPLHRAIHQTHLQEQKQRRQFKTYQAELLASDPLHQRQRQLRRKTQRLLHGPRPDRGLPHVLQAMAELARQHKLQEQRFKPGPPHNRDFYNIFPHHVVLTGRFHSFMRFIADVTAQPQLIIISDLDIRHTADSTTHPLRFQFELNVYRWHDDKRGEDHKKRESAP